MSVVIAMPSRARRIRLTRSRYFSAVYARCIVFRILFEPDCNGRWTCSASFGKREIASIKSSRKPIGCRGEAEPLEPVDVVNGFEQLHKRRFIVDLRKFVAA